MKGKKNDFSMSFWKSGKRTFFMEYVHDTDTPIKWLDKAINLTTGQIFEWDEVNIYERRTRKFIEKIKK